MIIIDPAIRLRLLLAVLMVALFMVRHAWKNRIPAPREYSDECSIRHYGGHGQLAEIAPILGRVGEITATLAGHHYIIDILLYGLTGPILADNERYDNSMPSFYKLPDAEIAHILTFVAKQEYPGTSPKFTPAEIVEARHHPLTPPDMLLERQHLDRSNFLP